MINIIEGLKENFLIKEVENNLKNSKLTNKRTREETRKELIKKGINSLHMAAANSDLFIYNVILRINKKTILLKYNSNTKECQKVGERW